MREEQYLDINEWQKETFGQATSLSKLTHLTDEIEELKSDLKTNNPHKRLEFADCFILLFGAAASDGMTYEDICDAIEEKMGINKKRTWGTPNEDGVVFHVKDNEV